MEQNLIESSEYDLILESLIPHTHEFSYLKGCEGRVYFVSDDLVLKEYYDYCDDAELFECFCRENRASAEKGYAVPKVYAWKTLKTVSGKPVFYVLKERIKGRTLRPIDISQLYSKFEDVCTREEFTRSRLNMRLNPELTEKIMVEYAKDFVLINETVLKVSTSELERFFSTLLHICTESNYTFTDTKPSNVMTDGESFIAIDNGFRLLGKEKPLSTKKARQRIIGEMFSLFSDNGRLIFETSRMPVKPASVRDLLEKNRELTLESLMKMIGVSTSVLGTKKIDRMNYRDGLLFAENLFGAKTAKQVMSEFEMGL